MHNNTEKREKLPDTLYSSLLGENVDMSGFLPALSAEGTEESLLM